MQITTSLASYIGDIINGTFQGQGKTKTPDRYLLSGVLCSDAFISPVAG